MGSIKHLLTSLVIMFSFFAVAHENAHQDPVENSFEEMGIETDFTAFSCKKPTASQINEVNLGNTKAAKFSEYCLSNTHNSSWCQEVMRPNPASVSTFKCTYGNSQVHQLINPDENTWVQAVQGVQLVRALESLGIQVCQIYNWWRPEPYNANVGGAAGRHPFGTSIDVKFCSKLDMERAFDQLCEWRAQGRLKALGYYGTYSLHFGVGDKTANTWGKSCPDRNLANIN